MVIFVTYKTTPLTALPKIANQESVPASEGRGEKASSNKLSSDNNVLRLLQSPPRLPNPHAALDILAVKVINLILHQTSADEEVEEDVDRPAKDQNLRLSTHGYWNRESNEGHRSAESSSTDERHQFS